MKDILGTIALIAGLVTIAYGWIINIVQLVQIGETYTTIVVVVKVVGIFVPPVGVVMGWIG